MVIDSDYRIFKTLSLSQQELNEGKIDTIPEDKVVPHDYKSLVRIAKDQIKHYIDQIL
jgi:hypothetical protein